MKKKIVMVSLQFQLSNEVFLASFMSHRICDVSAIHEKFTFTFLCDSIIPSERKGFDRDHDILPQCTHLSWSRM